MSGSHPRGAAIARAAVALLVVASIVAGSTAALAADGGASTARDSLADGASPAATALAAGGTGGDETVENASESHGSAVADEDGPAGRQRIPASLRAAFDRDRDGVASASATDTVEVVVRFREARAAAPAQANSAADLQEHASVTQAPFRAFVRRTPGIERRQDFWIANAMLVEVDPERVSLERLVDVPHVTRVHRNFEVELAGGARSATPAGESESTATTTPTDATAATSGDATTATSTDVTATTSTTATATTDGLEIVNATAAWDHLGTRGDGVDVAILDTGADPAHPDVDVDGWAEFDSSGTLVESGTEHARDTSYHGTHVAGTVLGGDVSGTHIGVAPDARHHHGLVLPNGTGSYAQVIGGIEWATNDVDADVVSMSLGASNYYTSAYVDPIRNARAAGTLVVASSGNDDEGTSSSPGNVYDAVSVGAVNDDRVVATFSSGETINTDDAWGASAPDDWPASYTVPQVTAPGVRIRSAWPTDRTGDYYYLDGTSMAAPHVAGAAALLFAGDSGMTVVEAERRLTETAIHPDGEDAHDHRYGHGVIDAYLAAQDGTISGAVTGIEDAPIENATVSLSGTATATATSGADGAFAFEGLSPSGNYTVAAAADRYHPANVSLALSTGESVTQNVSLDPMTGAVEGTVTDADTDDGVANASVTLQDAGGEQVETDETGPNGSYALSSVLHGDGYAVTAGGDRYESAERSNLSVAPDETTTVDLQAAPRPGAVAGTVLDGVTDSPVENATATLANDSGAVIGTAETAAEGDVSIDDVPPNDTYDLTVAAPSYDGWNETIAVGPNETVAPTPSLAPHDGSIAGVVTGAVTGDAIANATVVASGANGTVGTNRTSATGAFELQSVPRAVNYSVSVEHDSYEPDDVAVDVGPGEAAVRNVSVEPSPGTIAGVVTDGDGAPLADATIDLDAADVDQDTADLDPVATDADGSYELSGVPAEREQTLNVSARAHRANATVSAALAANGTTTRTVTLHRRDRYLGVDDLQAPDSVEEGENVTVTATVTNLGARNWTSNATYRVDGTVVATTALDLNASENATVAFAGVVDEPGTRELTVATVNETETVELAVESSGGGGLPAPQPDPMPDVAILSASVGSASVSVGEAVATDVTLRNRGDAAGSIELALRADGTTVASRTVDVAAGQTRTASLSTRFEEPGRYELTVAGEAAGSVEVVALATANAAAGSDTVGGATEDGTGDSESGPDAGNETDDGAGNRTDGRADETPGFGAGAGLVALAVATALAARRRPH